MIRTPISNGDLTLTITVYPFAGKHVATVDAGPHRERNVAHTNLLDDPNRAYRTALRFVLALYSRLYPTG